MHEPDPGNLVGPRSADSPAARGATTLAHWPAEARTWLAQTFAGLTWKRLGLYGLMVLIVALCKPKVLDGIQIGANFTGGMIGVLKACTFVALAFTPILLAVVAVANRGPRSGWARIATLAIAIVVGASVGKVLVAYALPYVSPNGVLARVVGLNAEPVVRIVRWVGLVISDIALSVAAVGLWYCVKRDTEAATELHREQRDREEVAREGAEARLQVMQAQIEPHFLFNSLASIRRLYETDPDAGRSMLQHLSRYLTASLPVLRAAHSTLGRELALAVAYLNVQKIRMGSRLAVEVDVPQPLHPVVVPPMMLATLVENAVIHGLSPKPAGGRILIRARAAAGRLTIEVADNGYGLQEVWGVGVGLANIRARLSTEFGNAASLQLVGDPDGGVTAIIELPLEAAARALAA